MYVMLCCLSVIQMGITRFRDTFKSFIQEKGLRLEIQI